jgi:hypothetical protein
VLKIPSTIDTIVTWTLWGGAAFLAYKAYQHLSPKKRR